MRLPWFRMYTIQRQDPRFRLLTDGQFRVWFNLKCFAAEQEPRGTISGVGEFRLAAEVADGRLDLLKETISILLQLEVIKADGDQVEFIDFEAEQYDKPSDRPEAVATRVNRSRNAVYRSGNATKRDVSRSNALEAEAEAEADTDSDTEKAVGESEGIAAAASEPDLPLGQDLRAVAEAYRRVCRRNMISSADQVALASLLRTVPAGVVLEAFDRYLARPPSRRAKRITSVHYFEPIIQEVLSEHVQQSEPTAGRTRADEDDGYRGLPVITDPDPDDEPEPAG